MGSQSRASGLTLSQCKRAPLYATGLGKLFVGDSLELMDDLEAESVDLVITSPPFALLREKEYGNKASAEYVAWFRDFAEVIWEKLRPDGSLVIDLGGAWNKGVPTRSLYQFKLLIGSVLMSDYIFRGSARTSDNELSGSVRHLPSFDFSGIFI